MAKGVISLIVLSVLLVGLGDVEGQAPAPSPGGPVDIFAVLEKAGGNYGIFIKFLNTTQVGNQVNIQVNSSTDGMTVFAPTDNAFNNLPSGTLNKLSDQQKILLIQYHVLPKFYSFEDLQTVSNPVRTQANGPDGQTFGLNFTGQNNQVNVSSGAVETQVYNPLRKDPPLAVYQLDKVLLPLEFTADHPAAKAPTGSASSTPAGKSNDGKNATAAKEPSPAPNGAGKMMSLEMGLVSGILMFCMGLLS
nr:fasciclin-like arabinogalactan protein 9 isoform X1 [Ipomoea trifida]